MRKNLAGTAGSAAADPQAPTPHVQRPGAPEPESQGRGLMPAVVRAIVLTGGRAAAQRAAPLMLGIAVVSGIVFGGNGMSASDLTGLAGRSVGVRVGLWGLWLLAQTPAVRALLSDRSALLLRALPVPRWQHYAVNAGLLMLLELPMIVLYGRGAGAAAALAATLFAMAGHTLLGGVGLGPRTVALAVGLAAALLWPGEPGRTVALILAATMTLGIALPLAWQRAAARPLPREHRMVTGPATLALLLAHLALVVRTQRPLLLRAAIFYLIALAVAHLALRNNHILDPGATAAMALLCVGPFALLAAGALAGAVLATEKSLSWLLLTCGSSGGQRVAAAHGAVMLLTAPLSALYGALLGALQQREPTFGLRLLGESSLFALLAAGAVTALYRWAQRGDPRDGDRVLLMQLALVPGALVAAWGLGELALGVWALATAILWGQAIGLAAPITRHGRLRRERAQRNSNQVGT